MFLTKVYKAKVCKTKEGDYYIKIMMLILFFIPYWIDYRSYNNVFLWDGATASIEYFKSEKEANIEANNLICKDYDETVLPTFLFFVLIVIILIYISFNISC